MKRRQRPLSSRWPSSARRSSDLRKKLRPNEKGRWTPVHRPFFVSGRHRSPPEPDPGRPGFRTNVPRGTCTARAPGRPAIPSETWLGSGAPSSHRRTSSPRSGLRSRLLMMFHVEHHPGSRPHACGHRRYVLHSGHPISWRLEPPRADQSRSAPRVGPLAHRWKPLHTRSRGTGAPSAPSCRRSPQVFHVEHLDAFRANAPTKLPAVRHRRPPCPPTVEQPAPQDPAASARAAGRRSTSRESPNVQGSPDRIRPQTCDDLTHGLECSTWNTRTLLPTERTPTTVHCSLRRPRSPGQRLARPWLDTPMVHHLAPATGRTQPSTPIRPKACSSAVASSRARHTRKPARGPTPQLRAPTDDRRRPPQLHRLFHVEHPLASPSTIPAQLWTTWPQPTPKSPTRLNIGHQNPVQGIENGDSASTVGSRGSHGQRGEQVEN